MECHGVDGKDVILIPMTLEGEVLALQSAESISHLTKTFAGGRPQAHIQTVSMSSQYVMQTPAAGPGIVQAAQQTADPLQMSRKAIKCLSKSLYSLVLF